MIVFSQTTFQQIFPASGLPSEFCSVKQTSDNGYIITGTTSGFGVGSTDIILIKTDETGNVIWSKTFGAASDNEYAYDVLQSADSGYIIAGKTYSFGAGWYDAYIVKTDASGNLQWSKTVGGAQNDAAHSVKQVTDGGFVFGGETQNSGNGTLDFYLFKTDIQGNLLWTKTYGGNGTEYQYGLALSSDGGFSVSGVTGGFGAGSWDILLVKTDSAGSLLWSKTYGTPNPDRAYALANTQDGGYILAGHTNQNNNYWLTLAKTDANGSLLWTKFFDNANLSEANSISECNDGGFIISGNSGADNFILKADTSGNVLWSKKYGLFTGDEKAYSSLQTRDNGFIILGYKASDYFLIKTDSSGTSGCNETPVNSAEPVISFVVSSPALSVSTVGVIAAAATQITTPAINENTQCLYTENVLASQFEGTALFVYPNPNGGKFTLKVTGNNRQKMDITVYSVFGQIVYQSEISNFSNTTGFKSGIDLSNQLPGIYFLSIEDKQGNKLNQKLTIQ